MAALLVERFKLLVLFASEDTDAAELFDIVDKVEFPFERSLSLSLSLSFRSLSARSFSAFSLSFLSFSARLRCEFGATLAMAAAAAATDADWVVEEFVLEDVFLRREGRRAVMAGRDTLSEVLAVEELEFAGGTAEEV